MRNDLVDLIKGKVDEGKCFINVSQCRKGNVDQKTYASGLKLSEIGVLSAEDMTFEAVVVKVMHLLGKKLSVEGFAREFQIDYAGELSM
jgi:L-asparaginase